jgi:hypothetical protein
VTGSRPKHISTSYVERRNLIVRTSMRRVTRLTNAFSKKLENDAATVSLYFMYYNFARVHQTLRLTPAMEKGATVPISLKFKTGNDREFPEAVEARVEKGTIVLKRADGSELTRFHAEHVVAINGRRLDEKSN